MAGLATIVLLSCVNVNIPTFFRLGLLSVNYIWVWVRATGFAVKTVAFVLTGF